MKPVKLRLRWDGDDPQVGDVLKARRGRTAYRIIEVTPITGVFNRRMTCWRIQPSEISPTQLVHEIVWDKRGRR